MQSVGRCSICIARGSTAVECFGGAVDGECSHFPSPPGHCRVYSTTVGSDTPEVLPSETGGHLSELLSLSRCFRVQWRALPRSKSGLGSHSLSQRCLCIFLKRNGRQHFHVFLSFKPLVVKLKVEQGRHQILGVLIHTTSVLRKCFWKILDICNCVICIRDFCISTGVQEMAVLVMMEIHRKGRAMANSRPHHYLPRLTAAFCIHTLLN